MASYLDSVQAIDIKTSLLKDWGFLCFGGVFLHNI